VILPFKVSSNKAKLFIVSLEKQHQEQEVVQSLEEHFTPKYTTKEPWISIILFIFFLLSHPIKNVSSPC